jgi:KaiC/GvpD/RAD55 family RecA-like ATPase
VLPEVRQLPTASEFVNEVDGLPIPIPGADCVLFRGLRFSENSGVVTRLSGRTGTGKTSIALGLAVALAPLGTRTIYLSCEEEKADLEHRIQTLVPQNIRRMDVFHRLGDNWFSAEHVGGDTEQKYIKVQEFLEHVKSRYRSRVDVTKTPPGAIRLLIVIDGVHELLVQGEGRDARSFSEQARRLIEECRATGAFVLILSAKNNEAMPDDLDYLVDFVAGVEFSSGDEAQVTRSINIYKTRRQESRVGHHVLHIAGKNGLSIAPHVGAQLEQRRHFKWVRPRTDRIFDFMLRPRIVGNAKSKQVSAAVEIYERSHILVTGVGSAAKSAFGLKLLTSPLLPRAEVRALIERLQSARGRPSGRAVQKNLFEEQTRPDLDDEYFEEPAHSEQIDLSPSWYESVMPNRRKLLVLSFLYQDDFYREVWRRIGPYRKNDTLARKRVPRVTFDVRSFSPGYLRPEDFLTIIGNWLDQQELLGWPYDGILIDGLHNVYLQFPYLERSEMVWPMLFEMLRTRGLTVVTTHTYFTIDPGLEAQRLDTDDVESARRRAAPLLHALVQATDFRLKVSAEKWSTVQELKRKYAGEKLDTKIDVIGAIGQLVTGESLYWNRDYGLVMDLPASASAGWSRGVMFPS